MKYYILESGGCEYALKVFEKSFRLLCGKASSASRVSCILLKEISGIGEGCC